VRSYDIPKSWESKTGTVSGLHFGSPGKKCHSGASATERHREYYREDGGESELTHGLSQHQMHAEWILTNLCWFWMHVRDQIA
jgi:hypothetical protein